MGCLLGSPFRNLRTILPFLQSTQILQEKSRMEQVQKIEKRNKHKPRIGGGASIVIYCLIFAYCCMGRNNYNDGGDSEPNPKKKQHSRWAS